MFLHFSRCFRRSVFLNYSHESYLYNFRSIRRLLSNMDFKTIGTHDGIFHCDEVFGCYMLKLLSPAASIVRSRDDQVLEKCDIVIDVGGIYDPEKKRFDHHQKSFEHSMSTVIPGKEPTIRLSSAGLIYCHYGKLVLRKILGNIEDDLLNIIFDKVYSNFVLEIDAIDNGIPICATEQVYYINTHLSARVKRLNPDWNVTDYDIADAFNRAMDLVGTEFKQSVEGYLNSWWPARKIVLDSVKKRYELHPSGEIMELDVFCPWISHYFEIEKELDLKPAVKYVIFPASQSRTVWRVQAVPQDENSFILRCPLKESWRGLRDDELSNESGIKDCIFVHSSGFIGGNKTREGALAMAAKSLT